MVIKKDTLVRVDHQRKGRFVGITTADIDLDNPPEFYPIAYAQEEPLDGVIKKGKWYKGDSVPCRVSMCLIRVIETEGS